MEIPVLDFGEFRAGDRAAFAARLGVACRESGFFLLSGHGIEPGLQARVFEEARRFFAQPEDVKQELSILKSPHNRGYARLGDESLDPASGQVDSKEAFNIGLDLSPDDPRVLAGEAFRGVNVWPGRAEFRAEMLAYFDAALALGREVMQAVAMDLGLPQDWFAPHFTAPLATLRCLRYPAAAGVAGEIGAGAHSDYGAVTLLLTGGVPGLQVKPRGGEWMDVPNVEGAYVVNIGDCLMRWTNDVYVSTPHRVLPPPAARYSLAFFLDPNPDSVVECLPGMGEAKYPPVTGADYLASRLNATYVAPGGA